MSETHSGGDTQTTDDTTTDMSTHKTESDRLKDELNSLINETQQPLALISNGAKASHIVDTRTFDNSMPVLNHDGYSENIGDAEALCGHEAGGRMLPVGTCADRSVCKRCLRSLRSDVENDE